MLRYRLNFGRWLQKIKFCMSNKLKIYILIKDTAPVGHAINCAAHASLALYLEYKNLYIMDEWLHYSFRKVTCRVSPAEFNHAKGLSGMNKIIVTESALNGEEIAIAFAPCEEWPDFFKTLRLYK